LYNLCICFKPKTKGCYLHMKKWSVSWVVSLVGDFYFFPCSLVRRCSCWLFAFVSMPRNRIAGLCIWVVIRD
jgi:lauroyl/myristoyl acyltransferase